jgi:hypothetical protein
MGEDEEREPEEQEPEAAVLPAHEAVSIITAGGERTDSEEPADDTPSSDAPSV